MQSSKLQNYTINYNNSQEYHILKNEVFTSDLYYFETENTSPYIIDAGAHIGLTTLYFKKIYPNSEVVAIEPNPLSIVLLEKNLFENQIYDVKIIKKALTKTSGTTKLFLDSTDEQWHSTASIHKGSWVGIQDSDEIEVASLNLGELITKPVDFLKLDIEGIEQEVLYSIKDKLSKIIEMHIEFHSHKTQSLTKVLELLDHTHKVELYQGTTLIPKKRITKATGLIQIRAYKR